MQVKLQVKPFDTKIIAFSNHKGGVGKTCSVCNIGAGLVRRGKKVLMIDLDPQASLSLSYGIKEFQFGIYEVLIDGIDIARTIYTIIHHLDIVPSSLDLAGAEIELLSEAGRDVMLKECLAKLIGKYDYILIDCSPSIGLLTTNALTAADEVIIPLQAHFLSLRGIEKLTDVINKIRQRLNKNLKISGMFITQFDARKSLNREISAVIDEHFAGTIFKTKIRDNIALAEAPSQGVDIFRYNPKSHGASDYEALCDEILTRHSLLTNEVEYE